MRLSRRAARRVLVLVLVLAASSAAHAQQTPVDPVGPGIVTPGTPLAQLPPALRAAADAGLRTFKTLVNEQNYQRLGFETPAEVRQATLDEPLRDMFVPLDRLRAHQPGADIKPLLVDGSRVLFPVRVGAAVRSSLTVARLPDGSFKSVSFGAQSFARAFSAARDAAAQASGVPPESFVIVRVPALNAQFLGFDQPGGLTFFIVTDDPRFELRQGSTLPASEVLGRMVTRARALLDAAPG
jgi:hypothetical protein